MSPSTWGTGIRREIVDAEEGSGAAFLFLLAVDDFDGSGGAEVVEGVGGVPAPRDVQGPGEFPQLLTGEGEAGRDLGFAAEDDHDGKGEGRGAGTGRGVRPTAGGVRLAPAES